MDNIYRGVENVEPEYLMEQFKEFVSCLNNYYLVSL